MYNPRNYANNLQAGIGIIKNIFQKNSKLLQWNSEPESIMDLGVGDGRIAKEVIIPIIPRNIKEYIGADISETMLKHAEKTINHDKFKTYLMDAQTKNLPKEMKNRFHHIFANFLLHHTRDTRQVFLNVQEMLKPGGQFMFNAFEEVFTDEAFEKLDQGKWRKYNHWKAISPFYKFENVLNEYEKVITSLDFVDCTVYTEKFDYRLPEENFDGLMSSVNARLPFVEEEDKEEYMKDYIEETKRTKMTRLIFDEKTNEKVAQAYVDIVTGIISKPL